MMLSFWTDAIVAVLLVATIGYSVVLNRRLGAVRGDREKFEDLIRNLATVSKSAETAIANLRTTADDLSRRLDKRVGEARGLSDDLVYMIERGGTIADKLAGLIRSGRTELRPDLKPEGKSESQTAPKTEHKIEALAGHLARAAGAGPRPAVARRETLNVDLNPAAIAVDRPVAARQPERAGATSRAERELLRALSRRA
jgi:hypothetical protein